MWLRGLFFALGICFFAGCTSAPDTGGSGGAKASGGTTGSGGGAVTGGSSGSGGSTGSGGMTTNGGATGAGGVSGSGGATSSGGVAATGGTTRPGTGGNGTGGSGRPDAGGEAAAGGKIGSGGAPTGGGVTGSGGATATGGTLATGGVRATGGTPATGGITGGGDATHTGSWQIMPLGDSITGTTCYPKLLAKELIDKGHTNFDFTGTVLDNQSCGDGVANVQTEGHGGYLVTYLITDSPPQSGKGTLSELKTWAAEKPDVVLLEYGTNDAWSSIAPASITSAYGFVVDQFRGQNPNVVFFVAQITPLNPSGCSNCEANVEALNAQIPTWASGKSTAASPIYVVNVWAALPAATYTPNSTYTSDGAHPNVAGSQLMADKWYSAIVAQGLP